MTERQPSAAVVLADMLCAAADDERSPLHAPRRRPARERMVELLELAGYRLKRGPTEHNAS